MVATPDGTVQTSSTDYVQGLLWGKNWTLATESEWVYVDGKWYQIDVKQPLTYNLTSTYQTWNSTEIAAIQSALQVWSNVADINFSMSGGASADLQINLVTSSQLSALGESPTLLGSFFPPDTAYAQSEGGTVGVGLLNQDGGGWHTAGLQAGGYGFSTILHEIGHALGLAHPHDDGGTSPTYTSLGIANDDTGLNTVMSYNDVGEWWNPESSYSTSTSWGTSGQTATPMVYDIAAIQHLYGANTTYNTGNNTYALLTDRYEAIWDAGGIDTITAAGLSGNTYITLKENSYLSSQFESFGGYTIAVGAVIENATGGSGDDTLVGNAVDNVLLGGEGHDYLLGYAGDDTLSGGDGYDVLDYSYDAANGGTSGIVLNLVTGTVQDGFGDTDTISGFENLYGTEYADSFTGGDDTLEFERFIGLGGNDVFHGGTGWDEISYSADTDYGGNAGITVNFATGIATDGFGNTDTFTGIESVRATNNADTLIGSELSTEGFERFRGLGGNDIITGGGGIDEIDYAHDTYYGGTSGVTVNLATGTATDGFGNTDTFTRIEAARGTDQADTLTGGNADNDDYERFTGLAGNDTINGGSGFDLVDYADDHYYDGFGGVTVNLATGTATDGFGDTDSLVGRSRTRYGSGGYSDRQQCSKYAGRQRRR